MNAQINSFYVPVYTFDRQVMVFFKDSISYDGVDQLVILDDERQPINKSAILTVHSPLTSKYAKQWLKFTNSAYISEWSREVSLGKNLTMWALQSTHN